MPTPAPYAVMTIESIVESQQNLADTALLQSRISELESLVVILQSRILALEES